MTLTTAVAPQQPKKKQGFRNASPANENIAKDPIFTKKQIKTLRDLEKRKSKPLEREEEGWIFKIYSDAGERQKKLREEIGQNPAESEKNAEEMAKLESVRELIRSVVVKSNQGLVYKVAGSIAKSRKIKHLRFLDLVQEGNLGLAEKAIEKFDYTRGYKFSTYATWWLRSTMGRSITETERTIRLPVHLADAANMAARFTAEYVKHFGAKPSDEEIAQGTGLSTKQIAAIRNKAVEVDLYRKDQDEDKDQMSMIADDKGGSPEERFSLEERKAALHGILERLDPRRREIIKKRFGIGDGEEITLQEVGDSYGLSRERIRQIERETLKTLRKMFNE